MLNVGVLVSGSGTNLQAILDKIGEGTLPIHISTVVSNNQRAYALERARQNAIEAVCIRKKDYADADEYEQALISHFKDRNVELIVMAGFMVILGKSFIRAFYNQILNIHPSLIPSFCGDGMYGLRVHEAVLEKGVKVTGATVHYVDEGTDTGPIVMQKAVDVLDADTPSTLQRRVMEEAEWVIYPEAIRQIAEGNLMIENNKVRRRHP